MSAPELSVVCRSCGSEVSPYVTECPYCGSRIRKRAPKLERHGDELTPREDRRQRKLRRQMQRRAKRKVAAERLAERPYATLATVLVGALGLLTIEALAEPATNFGAIIGDVGSEWWRYLAAPFVFTDVGYLFACGVAIVIFGSAIESRLGTVATAVLILACGALGMVVADGIEGALGGSEPLVAAGANGIALGLLAAWAVIKAGELRARPDEEVEVIGAAVVAVVLILLPVFVDWANVFAGLGGAVVGAACGLAATFARREKHAGD